MLHIVDHPLIQTKLNMMRDEKEDYRAFKQLLDEIASLMTFEVFKDLKTEIHGKIKTPTGCVIDKVRLEKDIIIVPILRAGIGMSNGVCSMLPYAKIGHIGLYRNEKTLQPVEYFCKMPKDCKNPLVLLCDPMLATGGSAEAAITMLKNRGFKDIRLLCLVGVQQGVDKVLKSHPETEIYLANLDEKLNEKGYILPGLGDAGDRIFGTL